MSKTVLLFLLMSAFGNFLYHIGQKSVALNGNPMLILNVFYALAWLLTLVSIPLFGKAGWQEAANLAADWHMWLVALGILLIELGILLFYKSGGSVQWAGVAVSGMAALLLLPASILVFHDKLSWDKIGGMLLVLGGLYLLSRK